MFYIKIFFKFDISFRWESGAQNICDRFERLSMDWVNGLLEVSVCAIHTQLTDSHTTQVWSWWWSWASDYVQKIANNWLKLLRQLADPKVCTQRIMFYVFFKIIAKNTFVIKSFWDQLIMCFQYNCWPIGGGVASL